MYTANHTFTSNLFSREQNTSREENSAQGWLRVDPESVRDPHMTPYHFVYNNPVMFIDPNGLHGYKVDGDGNISSEPVDDTGGDEFDVLYNEDMSKTSLPMKPGTLGNVREQSGTDSKGDPFTYDILKIRGDDQGSNLFEFLSENTNVEWSQFKLGEEGDNGLNYLTSSGDKSTEKGAVHFINTQLHDGYTIREHNHNHPGNTPYPSGLSDGRGDIGFSRGVENWYTKKYPGRAAPTFNIYLPGSGQYVPYNKNSTRADFFSIKLKEVIIYPK